MQIITHLVFKVDSFFSSFKKKLNCSLFYQFLSNVMKTAYTKAIKNRHYSMQIVIYLYIFRPRHEKSPQDDSTNDSIDDHEEEFYYTEVELGAASSPPTLSHRDMARPPHEGNGCAFTEMIIIRTILITTYYFSPALFMRDENDEIILIQILCWFCICTSNRSRISKDVDHTPHGRLSNEHTQHV